VSAGRSACKSNGARVAHALSAGIGGKAMQYNNIVRDKTQRARNIMRRKRIRLIKVNYLQTVGVYRGLYKSRAIRGFRTTSEVKCYRS